MFNSNEKVAVLSTYLSKTDILIRVLERETEYLRENQTAKAVALLETKSQYVNELENAKAILASDSAFLRSLPKEVKVKITEANNKLLKVAEENHKQLGYAKEVNKLIMESVYSAVSQHRSVVGGYGKTGVMYSEYPSSPVAVSENV